MMCTPVYLGELITKKWNNMAASIHYLNKAFKRDEYFVDWFYDCDY